MDQSFILHRADFDDGQAELAIPRELQLEIGRDAPPGMQPLLLAVIFASPLFWIVLFWMTFR